MTDSLYKPKYLPCGGVARFDESSGIGYRCEYCWAVVGSIGQPARCREESSQWHAYEVAGLWKWDYETGTSVPLTKNKKYENS